MATYPKNVWIGEPPASPCPDHDCADDDPCGEEAEPECGCEWGAWAVAQPGNFDITDWDKGMWDLDNWEWDEGVEYNVRGFYSTEEAALADRPGGYATLRIDVSWNGTLWWRKWANVQELYLPYEEFADRTLYPLFDAVCSEEYHWALNNNPYAWNYYPGNPTAVFFGGTADPPCDFVLELGETEGFPEIENTVTVVQED